MRSKRLRLFLLFFIVGLFLAGTAFAEEWYTVQVLNGYVAASRTGNPSIIDPPNITVANLDINYDPGVEVSQIDPILPFPDASLSSGGWNAVGWWEFAVTGSSGSGWNKVFGGGTYTFTADWLGNLGTYPNNPIPVHFGVPNATFDALYGKWIQNNPSVYTYFGLYTPPNTGPASTPGQPPAAPIGIFAFVADDPLLYPSGFELNGLYDIIDNYGCGGQIAVNGGSGTFRAVPEPAIMLLLGFGLAGLAGLRRKFSI